MYEIMFFKDGVRIPTKIPGKFETREAAAHEIKSRCKRNGAEIIALEYDKAGDGVDAMVKFGSMTIQYVVNRIKGTK